ncbi:MAG TPA: sigma-54-dependent Fis family transcriptional regulator [Leucothrix mucor]|uniref:Sigma-54-dependent Fis family transcriptional regulator n=1 Tax=Leucothrix mucor TaxID=45248 RepID=A0A7V2T176_LEUMU|nr:sigma-54-dependent Fis family transcriptional regulator [Leucothrix mucor]
MNQQRVLIIDDEPDIRELLEITLLRMGLDTVTAGTVKEAMLSIQEFKPDLCLTDMRLPDGSGFDIVRYIQRDYAHIPVAVITAYGSMEAAVEALKAGAYDFVSKPVDLTKLRDLVQTALKLSDKENIAKKKSQKSNTSDPILGESASIARLKATIAKLARSQAPVFVHGESGSGKELVARQIHEQSPRAKAPFIPVNCGAIPENLMESEFFGHKKGSFTGAIEDKIGLFQAAHHGTLFLDEVADLPLGMQVKLLRAIQEKAIKPVGGTEEIAVDSRILSATHKDLETEVSQGRFRQDLYYRLNVIKLDVPPLREREADVLLLAGYFLKLISSRWQLPDIKLSETAKQVLAHYNFPGNVRELENILERASTLCDDNIIQPENLQLPEVSPIIKTAETIQAKLSAPDWSNSIIMKGGLQPNEQDLILQALDQTRWNRTAAAKLLGMTFRQLRYRIKKYGLDQV